MSGKILRSRLAALWRAHLHAHFRDAREVAEVYGCSLSTAHRWWGGDPPSAAAVVQTYEGPQGAEWSARLRRGGQA